MAPIISIFQGTVEVSEGSTWFSFVDHGYTEDEILAGQFCVLILEKGTENHYSFLDAINDKPHYGVEKVPLYDIAQTLAIVRDYREYETAKTHDFYSARLLDPLTYMWARSIMPRKRTRIPFEIRDELYKKYSGHCAYCGRHIEYSEMQVDHVESHYRHLGEDRIENYLPSCRDCNGLKSDYLLEEFRNVLIPECAKKAKVGANTRNERIAKAYHLSKNATNPKIEFYFEKIRKKTP